jgi:hypothetical protein
MPTFGYIQRSYPKLLVLRGFDPNEPRTRQISYPISATSTNNTNGVIYSGQVISLWYNATLNREEWVLGVATTGATPHLALQDSTDADVVESGVLTGLSCSGQFELQTGYFDGNTGLTYGNGSGVAASSGTPTAQSSYNPDVPLTFSTIIYGNITTTTWGSGAPVIGLVSRNRGPIFLGTPAAPPACPGGYGIDSSVIPANDYAVSFNTHFDQQNPAVG